MTDEKRPIRIEALESLGVAFEEALKAQPPRRRRLAFRAPRRSLALAGAVLFALGGGAVASGLLGPWQTDEPAGTPPEGRFELKTSVGAATYGLLVWRPPATTSYERAGDVCYEAGPVTLFRDYPLREGGSCFDPERAFADPGFVASRSQRGEVTLISGVAGPDVVRILLDDGSGERELTLSERSRAFMAVVGDSPVEVFGEQRDGRRRSLSFDTPPPVPLAAPPRAQVGEAPRQSAEAAVLPALGDGDTTFRLAVRTPQRPAIYEVRLTGPGGRDCGASLQETFGIGLTAWRTPTKTGFVAHELTPRRIATAASATRARGAVTDGWCPGTYQVALEFVHPADGNRALRPLTFRVR